MKTFLNVLYRRILYKIPLKLLLVLLAIFGLLFAVSKADLVATTNNQYFQKGVHYIYKGDNDIRCIKPMTQGLVIQINVGTGNDENNHSYNIDGKDDTMRYIGVFKDYYYGYCIFGDESFLGIYIDSNGYIEITDLNSSEYTSQQCQSEYNLIPINEVDSSYCQSNNLCPAGGTPSDCPNVGVSNLFINDIFHPGAFNIIMNIPEEISRDYAYTNSGYNFNLDIEGYNVDYEKMQSVIDSQSYIPTEEDFQNIIAILTPYTKIIVFFVFLFIVWAWIKKPFKSKKL